MALMESQKGRFEASFLPHLRIFLSLSCAPWPPRVLRVCASRSPPAGGDNSSCALQSAPPHRHRHRPDKTATVQPLGVERQSNSIVHKALISEPPRPRNYEDISANGSRPRLSCTSKSQGPACLSSCRLHRWRPRSARLSAPEIIGAPEPRAPAPGRPHRRRHRQSPDDPCQRRSPSARSLVWQQPPARPQRQGRPAQSRIARFEG